MPEIESVKESERTELESVKESKQNDLIFL